MIRNILLKTTALTLTLGFLINSSLATKRHCDDDFPESKELKTAQQLVYQAPEEIREMVFLGKPLLHISSYLGRLEVGRMQQVNKSINHFFIKGNESLPLWKEYAQQLQLDVGEVTRIATLTSYIKDYYTPQVYPLLVSHQTRFQNIKFTCCNFKRSILAGWAVDKQNYNYETAIMCENGQIMSLNSSNERISSGVTGIGIIGSDIIMVGWAQDKENNSDFTAMEWRNGKGKPLEPFNQGKMSYAAGIGIIGSDIIIVGWAKDKGNNSDFTAMEWRNGKGKPLEPFNKGKMSYATGIGIIGSDIIIVGWATNGNRKTAMEWRNGKGKSLGYFNGGLVSEAEFVAAKGPNTIVIGWANDGQNKENKTPVRWIGEQAEPLSFPNSGYKFEVKGSSADGLVTGGSAALKDLNFKSLTAVIWKGQETLFLNDFPFKELHDHFQNILAVSSNGSDFVAQTRDNYYKVHLPRYDLWKMK